MSVPQSSSPVLGTFQKQCKASRRGSGVRDWTNCTLQTDQYWVFALALNSSANQAKKALAQDLVGFRQQYSAFLQQIQTADCYGCLTCAGRILHPQMDVFHFQFQQGGCITLSLFTLNPRVHPSFRHTKVRMAIFNSLPQCVHATQLACSFTPKRATVTAWHCYALGLIGQMSAVVHEQVCPTLRATEAIARTANHCGIDDP